MIVKAFSKQVSETAFPLILELEPDLVLRFLVLVPFWDFPPLFFNFVPFLDFPPLLFDLVPFLDFPALFLDFLLLLLLPFLLLFGFFPFPLFFLPFLLLLASGLLTRRELVRSSERLASSSWSQAEAIAAIA